jgi:predicted NUDIX family NTP pyrophosphohydrolase
VAKQSAGILLFRNREGALEVLLVHPGGPYWAKKDVGAWSIPKGEYQPGEDPETAAHRELAEETGWTVTGDALELEAVKQDGGKTVRAWALEASVDPESLASNTFSMEWPPRSGQHRDFPEVDRAAWFGMDEARRRILGGQLPLLDDLELKLRASSVYQRFFQADGA